MLIRKSTELDFDRIMKIYTYARKYMAEHGNPNQWGPTNWPPAALIHNDIKDGNSYVCVNEEGTVIGSFCINWAFRQCGHLRIDTHDDNKVMQKIAGKLGFIHCGTIYVEEDHDPRLAFEKTGTV